LFVDDDRVDRLAFERFMRKEKPPFDYFLAASTKEAVGILSKERIDVVVTDYLLGDGNALALMKQFDEIPTIVVTGKGDEEVAVAAMKAGAYDYLIKDSQGGHLKTLPITVEKALSRKRTEEELIQYRERLEEVVEERTAALLEEVVRRKQTEEVLRIKEYAIESSVAAFIIASLDSRLEYVNQSFLNMWGYADKAEVLGRKIESLGRKPEEMRAAVDVARDKGKYRGEFTALRKNGEVFELQCALSLATDIEGKPIRLSGTFLDISEKKRLEQQFRQAQKLEAVARLAGGVAYDFNNLLTIIGGYTDLLLKQVDRQEPIYKKISQIHRAAKRAETLTDQLLAFSRKQAMQPRVLALNDLIRYSRRMLERLIDEKIEMVTQLAPDLGNIRGDPGQIEQVIMNLVINSRDAMPAGGKLIIETANVVMKKGDVEFSKNMQPGEYVSLTVTDTGIGMDKETQTQIFEPFFTSRAEGGGSGLGLSTVYGIVRQSGGYILVESKPGQGTTFRLYFPRVDEPIVPEDEKKPEISESFLRGSETILVVEDDDEVRQLICSGLLHFGYEVLEAADGGAALRTAKKTKGGLHLIITNVVMARMSGQQLVKRILKIHPAMNVLFVSGFADDSLFKDNELTGKGRFLQKPFTRSQLLSTVREILDQP
jgi:two-component system cell cycle sensor histidine kinase/response regulator CckA